MLVTMRASSPIEKERPVSQPGIKTIRKQKSNENVIYLTSFY